MITACAVDDLPVGESVRISPSPRDRMSPHPAIAVFNADGEFYAIDDTCSHQDASLSEGWLEGCFIECPLHAASFDLRTGVPTCLPAKKAVRTYPVVVRDGMIYVDTGSREAVA